MKITKQLKKLKENRKNRLASVLLLLKQQRKSRYQVPRVLIRRDFDQIHSSLTNDLFSASAQHSLEKEFRLPHSLFEKIYIALAGHSRLWTRETDAINRQGIHPELKLLVSLKILADGCTAEGIARDYNMSPNSVRRFFYSFCHHIVQLFGEDTITNVLVSPVKVKELMAKNKLKHGVSGRVGSIDCVHVVWHACPTALQGQYKSRFKHPTLVTEACCDSDLRFSHVFSGLAGTMNDITILRQSPLLHLFQRGAFPRLNFLVNKENFTTPYFYGDGAYPPWPMFLTAPRVPVSEGEKAFTKKQESARKDIERAFGVLKKRFRVLKVGLNCRNLQVCANIIRTCFILHNLIIDDRVEKGLALDEEEQVEESESEEEKEEAVAEVFTEETVADEDELWYFSRTEHQRLRSAVYKAFESKDRSLR